ncbi:ribosomal protein S12 methylthiotransferase accessory factor [Tistlia consotensis]|uniref:Ribosomal protein S12 methylthiotransferase accessory factor n=1 Tax=Tistlia consotensis USBA 355 TaxID=560819 RepID=A0A1Y6CDY2_9PROT|nr:YcaO-like family protein [Tistlia consotensis]SMF51327.1 ribosomal protein S12 methylthiotransferase accessory factor [Tistlia consotensis USBA 355]SNR84443.1 ribosomal protein S12 methylthiotransferase accessory factor [Tistlia consotensis]
MFVEFEPGFLAACAETLRRRGAGEPAASRETETIASAEQPAEAFLRSLGYLPADATDADTLRSRLALVALAGRFDRAFRLPMRHAPGAFFFGGQLSPAGFGLSSERGRHLGVAGRGLTLQQAFESCVGEAAERLSFHEWPGDRTPPEGRPLIRAPRHDDRLLAGAELDWVLREMGLPGDSDPRMLDGIEAISLADGEPLLLPAALCLLPAPGRPGVPQPAGSTGCAAGPSVAAATLSALEEVVERDAVAGWWQGAIPPRAVAPSLLQELGLDALAGSLRDGSPRRHWFLDITGPLKIPAFVALSAYPEGRAVVAGYGAGLDLRRALLGALLELCQAELAQELALLKRRQRGEEALNAVDRRWIEQYEQATADSHPRFTPGAPPQDHAAGSRSLAATLSCLTRAGRKAYRVDLSRPPLGLAAVRAVVPGLHTGLPAWTAP